jgi:hypothetical protein
MRKSFESAEKANDNFFTHLNDEYKQSDEFKFKPKVVKSDPKAKVFKSYKGNNDFRVRLRIILD